MKHTSIASAIFAFTAAAAAFPASAQWGGLGDPGWGWKKPVCHYCLSATEISVYGGKGDSDSIRYLDSDQRGQSSSQDATHYAGSIRVGLGPYFFLDGGYRNIGLDGSNSGFSFDRELRQFRYGGGAFLFSNPKVGALYIRAGGTGLQEKVKLSISGSGETFEQGASRSVNRKSVNEFGGTLGGFLTRGDNRIELSYGYYGNLSEADVVYSYGFNKRLSIRLGAGYLFLRDRGTTPITVGGVDEFETRTFEYRPRKSESVLTYGVGLILAF